MSPERVELSTFGLPWHEILRSGPPSHYYETNALPLSHGDYNIVQRCGSRAGIQIMSVESNGQEGGEGGPSNAGSGRRHGREQQYEALRFFFHVVRRGRGAAREGNLPSTQHTGCREWTPILGSHPFTPMDMNASNLLRPSSKKNRTSESIIRVYLLGQFPLPTARTYLA